MKKTVLTLVIGIIIGSSLGLVAYGATQQTVEAVFMDIKYLLNGEVVEFENKPLVYNQTTYVPIREAANLLGLEVDWDQERQMVVLNNRSEHKNQNSTQNENNIPNNISNGNLTQNTPTKGDDNLTDPSNYYKIIDREKNISYDPEQHVGYYFMTEDEYNAFKSMPKPSRLHFAMNILNQFAEKFPSIFETTEKSLSFKYYFIFNNDRILEFQDLGDNSSQTLEIK